MYVGLAENFERRQFDFFSQFLGEPINSPSYWSFEDHSVGMLPPSPKDIIDMYETAFRSDLSLCHISDEDRIEREMQGVTTNLGVVVDHHHGAVSNYRRAGLTKDTAFATSMVSTGEVPGVFLVPTTKMTEVSHGLEQMSGRPDFNPRAYWLDTYPSNKDYFEEIFGDIKGHLGMYHFFHRIVETLRQNHHQFIRACDILTKCVYRWDDKDYHEVLAALQDGYLGGYKHGTDDIEELLVTGLFKKRYSRYIKKVIYQYAVILQNLEGWWVKYKTTASADKMEGQGVRDPVYSTTLFTAETKNAFEECKKKARELPDKIDAPVYLEKTPPPRSKHKISVKQSLRGESNLESFHLLLSGYANNGMRHSTADCYTLSGIGTHNCNRREDNRVWTQLSPEEIDNIPSHLRGVARHRNHSNLDAINLVAAEAGCGVPPYVDVLALGPHTGEVFLSKYYYQQVERNAMHSMPKEKNSKRCPCPQCSNRGRLPPLKKRKSQSSRSLLV